MSRPPRARIAFEDYQKLVEVFRRFPGNGAKAAAETGLDARTCLRAWREGWPSPDWCRKPIEQLFEEEEIAARARVREEEERVRREREAARVATITAASANATDDRAKELQASRSTLSTALTALGVAGLLSRPMIKLAEKVAKAIEADLDKPDANFDRAGALELLRQYNVLTANASLVAKRAIEAARLVAGKPQKLVGVMQAPKEQPIRAEKAVELLGSPEEVEAAAAELYAGNLTPRALLLVESQAFEETTPRN